MLIAFFFSWNARARTIFQATKLHATNLMKYVALYKTLLLIQKKANGGKERRFDTFFAGLVGGYVVFGERNAINEQVGSPPPPGTEGETGADVYVCVGMTKQGGAVHLLARNRIIHTPRWVETAVRVGGGETDPSGLAILLRLRRLGLGRGHVAVREQGGDDPAGHVQLDDLPLPGFERLDRSTDAVVAEQVRVIVTYVSDCEQDEYTIESDESSYALWPGPMRRARSP